MNLLQCGLYFVLLQQPDREQKKKNIQYFQASVGPSQQCWLWLKQSVGLPGFSIAMAESRRPAFNPRPQPPKIPAQNITMTNDLPRSYVYTTRFSTVWPKRLTDTARSSPGVLAIPVAGPGGGPGGRAPPTRPKRAPIRTRLSVAAGRGLHLYDTEDQL